MINNWDFIDNHVSLNEFENNTIRIKLEKLIPEFKLFIQNRKKFFKVVQ